MTRLLHTVIKADASQLKGLRDSVRQAITPTGCPLRECDAIILAVNEAAMNIIQHAYAGRAGDITVEIHNNNGELVISLRDRAPPVDVAKIQPRDLDDLRPGGLGTHFMRQLMDTVSFSVPEDGIGNKLEMRITINGT